jgi:hypothetical protein
VFPASEFKEVSADTFGTAGPVLDRGTAWLYAKRLLVCGFRWRSESENVKPVANVTKNSTVIIAMKKGIAAVIYTGNPPEPRGRKWEYCSHLIEWMKN